MAKSSRDINDLVHIPLFMNHILNVFIKMHEYAN